ncbi:MAG: hypothetical protein C5B53_10825 [Candidatus Melainabacteria bacterium]|nr:MAG: hypothetical protein C5B53_10825 [Candidatus Melainabacteria bacterium]
MSPEELITRLRKSERIFRLLVEGVKDYAIFMLDPDGHIASWNEGAERIKGYTADEIIGKHFSIFYPQEAIDDKHPQQELAIALRDGKYEEEGWRLRKDGSSFWASVVLTAIYEDQEFVGFAKVTRDLTERKQAEEALRQARDEALEASEAKSRFLSTVSHEVRTPMAGIIGIVELICASAASDDVRELARAAMDSCKRLLQILNDVLDASKLNAGAITLENRSFAVRPIIGDLVQLASPEASKKKLQITAHVAENVPQLLCGDELRVRQILQNLVFNAVKFTAQGQIKISVELVGKDDAGCTLKFIVADTGIGISEEQQKKIFEPFQQATDSTTRVYGGTGLGLSICRTLTDLMNGELGVKSQINEGSTFWVVIRFGDELCQRE